MNPSLREVRAAIVSRPGLVGVQLREELSAAYDAGLQQLFTARDNLALVAVGGLGRREPAPCSDLDLVLLHDGKIDNLTEIAEAIWYPVWDGGLSLDHSVRTPGQAIAVAKDDLKALLGLLDIRHVAGDAGLTGRVRTGVLDVWRATAARRVPELRAISAERWAVAGEGAFLLEPNVKDSRGGLRDGQSLRALAMAQLVDYPARPRAAYPVLLDVRGELHRVTGRADDVLRQQEHDPVAAALGLAVDDRDEPRDVLLRRVNEAARVIAHSLDVAWRRIEASAGSGRTPRRRLFGAARPSLQRIGLARDVVAHEGEVVLARDADPRADPGLVLRVARAAAENDLPIGAFTLDRLASQAAPLPTPWPPEVRDDFLAVLGTGQPAIAVLESLDEAGLLVALIPEWDAVRCRAQHNPVHRFTVDRHLLETAAAAAEDDSGVERRDLLLVGALLHDIGKGYPGDHSIVGAEHARKIAARMGFPEPDVEVITALTRHHLLLPDTATRRDLNDPMTITLVTEAVAGDAEVVGLLHALAIADAAATGPAAWSEWKAGLIAELVARSRAVLGGAELPGPPPLDAERRELAEAGRLAVVVRDREVVVAAPDAVGVLYRTVGVLALHLLDIRQASIRTYCGMAVNSFVIEPRFGRVPDPALLRAELARALAGEVPLAERLREKERAYAERTRNRPPTITWFDEQATDATVLEIRTEDSIGLLTRITAALERAQLDVRTAQLATLGHSVTAAFYLTDRRGARLRPEQRADVELELRRI
ncbi:MAG TPA: [protein-PII] uridylyltransferase [Jatrophihabitantaceae bacterium]|nr:[protein-PII] uridylyltransferase [Jatrophihabitantaceae bacterium]